MIRLLDERESLRISIVFFLLEAEIDALLALLGSHYFAVVEGTFARYDSNRFSTRCNNSGGRAANLRLARMDVPAGAWHRCDQGEARYGRQDLGITCLGH